MDLSAKVRSDGPDEDQFRRRAPRRAASRRPHAAPPADSSASSAQRSDPVGSSAETACRRRGHWPASWACPAESSSRPTSSWSPRATSSRPGGATRVGARPCPTGRATLPGYRPREAPPINFASGRPDVASSRARPGCGRCGGSSNEAPSERLSYLDPRGAAELREALASYLNRVRGTVADARADRHLQRLRPGASGSSSEVAQGAGRGASRSRTPASRRGGGRARHGLGIARSRSTRRASIVAALARTDADAVVVTPAHQFPTGAVLSAERRAALVAWATDRRR